MQLEDVKNFSKENQAPILRDKSADFLCNILKDNMPDNILEIGTCFGYSASLMLNCCPNSKLTTVEIEEEKCKIALQNFKKQGFEERATIVNGDAFLVLENLVEKQCKFDFIFLDGPKGQYLKQLPLLKQLLNKNGIIFADNIYFFGMVKQGYPKHKHRTIVLRLREFIKVLKADKDFEVNLFDVDDGLLVAYLK